jgi:hypothetical protein
VFLARIVIPFSRSRSPESIARSSTCWCSPKRRPARASRRQGGLAVVDVRDDRDVAQVGAGSHAGSLRKRERSERFRGVLMRACLSADGVRRGVPGGRAPSGAQASLSLPAVAPFPVLFVCVGNLCRSPYAEILLRSRLTDLGAADRFEIGSAGVLAEVGRADAPPDEPAAGRGRRLAEGSWRGSSRSGWCRLPGWCWRSPRTSGPGCWARCLRRCAVRSRCWSSPTLAADAPSG